MQQLDLCWLCLIRICKNKLESPQCNLTPQIIHSLQMVETGKFTRNATAIEAHMVHYILKCLALRGSDPSACIPVLYKYSIKINSSHIYNSNSLPCF